MYDVMPSSKPRAARRAEREAADEGAEYWSPDRHRTIAGEEVLELIPALEARNPTSGYLFYDCQTDDSRLVLTVLGEAERFGAVCVNGARGRRADRGGRQGRRRRVRGRASRASGSRSRADNVVNATGVWADRIRPEELHDEEDVPVIRPSRGTHILLDREKLPLNAGAIVPAGAGRTIFALPWLGQTLVGTTDNDYEGEPRALAAVESTTSTYLLDGGQRASSGRDFGAGDLAGAYAGVRPLISTGDPKKSVDISRKAELYETSSGMITITGGKLTTWRRMAKMVVDRIVEREFRDAPCRTHEIPLGHPVDAGGRCRASRASASEASRALAGRYGLFAERRAARRARARRAAPADRRRPAGPARRGRRRGAPRAGAHGRRRAAAPHAARACSPRAR